MAGRRTRGASERLETEALVVRRVPVGEADLLVTFLTRERGLVSASARGVRRAQSKLGLVEPIHGLSVSIDLPVGADIGRLVEARLVRARLSVLDTSARLDAASCLLRWARSASSPLGAEPAAFDVVWRGLDALDDRAADPSTVLVAGGLALLEALGYGLELTRCVRCGAPCPRGAAALLDPSLGGLVCRACGGGPLLLRGALRDELLRLACGEAGSLSEDDVAAALDLLERAVGAHTGRPAR